MKLLAIFGLFLLSAPVFAGGSPTGWRGPVREAGRPWLNNTYYQPSYTVNQTVNQGAQASWQWDATKGVYWTLDQSTGIVWLYSPASGQYSSYHTR